MKVTWYEPPLGVMRTCRTSQVYTNKYTANSGYFVVRDDRWGWNIVRVDFDESDAGEDVLQMKRVVKAAAEIRVADWKEKHGVAV